ncbi:MAG: PAS domain-containing sensor histidine kinase [Alphaproteobacteria bacterium]|nr:PAS domain-containing sensor histidine kinase [Alphaproteobacteria bacterium]
MSPLRTHRPLVLAAVAALLSSVLLAMVTERLLRAARGDLLAGFADDRATVLDEAAARIEESLRDVAEDADFAADLVRSADTPDERQQRLGTLLASVRAYRAVFVFDADGALVDEVTDTRRPGGDVAPLRALAAGVAAEAMRVGGVQVSPGLSQGDDAVGLRAFAVPLDPDAPAVGSVVLVADPAPLLAPVSLVTAEPATHLLVVGPHGATSAVSSPTLSSAVAEGRATALLARVAGQPQGAGQLGPDDAAALGLPRADAVLAWRRVAPSSTDAWLVLSLSSTEALRSHQRALLQRLLGGAGAAGLVLAVLIGWVAAEARRGAVLAERLESAQAVSRANERARRVLAHLPAAVLLIGPDGCVRESNPAALDRFDQPPEGVPLSTWWQAVPDGERDDLLALVDEARRTGRTGRWEERSLLLPEATRVRRPWRVQAVPLPDEDAVMLVLDDLSELSDLHERLLRAEKRATVGELAAGIAHEIGTPLGVIQGRAEYIRGKLGEDHPQAAGLDVIVEQIGRVSRIIRSLLDYARDRPPTDPGQRSPVAPALGRVGDLLSTHARKQGVELDVQVPDGALVVLATPDALDQVLVNLVKNALDASDQGGAVVVRAAPDGAGHVQLVVEDQGHGIAPELAHRVFDPFFTTRKRGQGTGLGLAVTQRILREHGGTLRLEPRAGRGTRAIVRWPVGGARPGA